jgi:hypothetical protein
VWYVILWAVEIVQYDVEFVPRRTIKSQALVDFIAEWMNLGLRGIDDLPDHLIMLIPPEDDVLKYVIQIEFSATNNTA